MVTLERRLQLRRGPGANHAVIATAEVGSAFKIIGRNIDASWWQIDYNGTLAWVPSEYVTAINTRVVSVVRTPTPLPSPTLTPTTIPTVTPTPVHVSDEDWELILTSVKNDILGAGGHPHYYNQRELDEMASERAPVLNEAAEKCGLSMAETLELIDKYTAPIEEAGISADNNFWMRWAYMSALAEDRQETDMASCDWHLKSYMDWIFDQHGHSDDDTRDE